MTQVRGFIKEQCGVDGAGIWYGLGYVFLSVISTIIFEDDVEGKVR